MSKSEPQETKHKINALLATQGIERILELRFQVLPSGLTRWSPMTPIFLEIEVVVTFNKKVKSKEGGGSKPIYSHTRN